VLGLAACGITAGGSKSGSADGGVDAVPTERVPLHHRTVGTTCTPAPLPSEPEIPDAGLGPSATFECRTHADRTAQPRGRCIFYPTSPPTDPGGTRCIYDECTTDIVCAPEATCVCGTLANICVQGNCRVDADCGPNGYCSPGLDACGNPVGFYCHTAADTCIDDTDCTNGLSMKCIPDATTHMWGCASIGCASAAGQ
jgi:hypothetical protein